MGASVLLLALSACEPDAAAGTLATPQPSGECSDPGPGWIWCDDFEEDRLESYFEYKAADGSFVRALGVGLDGSHGMRVRYDWD